MNSANPSSTDRFHLATKHSKPPLNHKPKLCACGRRAYARQLAQYGKCDKCTHANGKAESVAPGSASNQSNTEGIE